MGKRKNNSEIGLGDRLYIKVMDRAYCEDMFGKDHLEEFGTWIPEDLLDRVRVNEEEFQKLQKELEKYHV